MVGSDGPGDDTSGPAETPRSPGDAFEQDPHVARLRPDPSVPPADVAVLEGLAGNSDREGWARLYLDRSLTYYAEFRREDIVYTEPIPPDQAPMLGMKATRVGIRNDAVLEFTRATRARPRDEFDLDVRLAAPGLRSGAVMLPAQTWEAECPGNTRALDCGTVAGCWPHETVQITICRGHTCVDVATCDTCQTACDDATCATCRTRCNQATCRATCATCQTRCNQATCQGTCVTCQTACGQQTCVTCNTCQTRCGQATCVTCETRCNQPTCQRTCLDDCGVTNNPHVFTCGPNPQCR